jgi:uncharacterized protein YdeI (YjbR/CyaY-like superfamily)
MQDPASLFPSADGGAIRIEYGEKPPSDRILRAYILEAVHLNETGAKVPSKPKPAKPEAAIPEALAAALKGNKQAKAAFEAFSPSHRREYIEWIKEAKRDETRNKRISQTLEWLAEGKSRNWKHERR